MANLGTLDMASRYALGNSGQDTFDKYLARQIATDGSDSEKLAYLLGGMLGNYYGKQRAKKDNEKIDNIRQKAQEGKTVYSGDGIGASAMTPEQEKSLQQYNAESTAIANQPTANSVISGGDPTSNPTDEYLRQALQSPTTIQATQENTNGGMNNYNWQYVQDEARKQGISNRVLQSRKAEIQEDIAQKARAIYEPQIRENIYGKAVTGKDGKQTFMPATQDSMIKGLGQIEELRKYDPTAADKYSSLVNNNLAIERAATLKLNQAKELNNMKLGQMEKQAQITKDTAKYLGDNGLTKNGARQPRTALKESDRLALGKRVSELEATLKDRYPNGQMDLNDFDVMQWRQGYIDLGYDDPIGPKGQQGQKGNGWQPGQKKDLKTAFTNRLNEIDVSNWDSINKGGLEMVQMLRDNGMGYDDAMENVLNVLKPRISPEEYNVFKGDFRTKEERKQDTLHPKPYQPFKDWTLTNDSMGRELKRKYEEEQKKNQQQ